VTDEGIVLARRCELPLPWSHQLRRPLEIEFGKSRKQWVVSQVGRCISPHFLPVRVAVATVASIDHSPM
jgi:hypothetical protein